jgi:transcription antitermination factor NusA-like protein
MEVPEIFNGAVEIVAIAREPGWRSKVGVFAKQDGVDAVGSCVGLRGIRIQSIVNELHGEKIDVVEWNKVPATFIANALSPSTVMRVDINEETGSAVAVVPERQLSLAIGKEGQNARLAARLSGWKVDIKSNVEAEAEAELAARGPVDTIAELELSTRVTNILANAGIEKVAQVLEMSKAELLEVDKFGQKALDELYGRLSVMKMLPKEPVAAAEPEKPEPVATEPEVVEQAVEVVAEPAEAEAPADGETVEAPAAEVTGVEVAVPAEAASEAEVTGVEVAVPAEAASEAEVVIPEELFVADEPAGEPVPVGEPSTSIQDLPEDIWTVRTPAAPAAAEAGGLRFREDIEELSRGDGPGRSRRRSGSGYAGRGRRAKARKRR